MTDSPQTPAAILAKMAEAATPELLATALETVYKCAECSVEKKKHPQRECKEWVPRWGPVDTLRLIDTLVALSRHEGKADKEFGLDKRVVVTMEQSPLARMLEAAGYTPETFKALPADKRQELVLGFKVIDMKALTEEERQPCPAATGTNGEDIPGRSDP